MRRIFIAGAAGGVGLHLTRRLIAAGDEVMALSRRAERDGLLSDAGAQVIRGDLVATPGDRFTEHLRGVDAVVFTAGAKGGGDARTTAVDGEGVAKLAGTAEAAGVSRFYLVSAFPDAWRERRMPPAFEHYMAVKRQADVALAATDLDWVILRPGTLTDDPGEGRIRIGPAVPYGAVSRADVAATLHALIDQPRLRRVILELTVGDTPIAEALARLDAPLRL